MERFLKEHLLDLSDRAERQYTYTYSDFLTPEEQSEISAANRDFAPLTFFGGTEEAERRIARFGDEDTLGYDEDFPVACVEIVPKNAKFAEALSHRDVLGALMSLGIERALLGDICVRGQEAYVFCCDRIADFLCAELTQIRHTQVKAARCVTPPEGKLYETRTDRATVTSLRLDCMTAAFINRSRGVTDQLITEKKVFLNGVPTEDGAKQLKPGDKVSVRGFGKFRFKEETGGTSKKGKYVILFETYL